MKQIAIIGAGGLGREVACIINKLAEWDFIGFYDDGVETGIDTGYGKVIGSIGELNNVQEPIDVVLAIGNPETAEQIAARITNPLVSFPNIIDSDAYFYDRDSLKMGKGNIIGPNASVSCNVTLGDFNILNVFSQVGHDAVLGNHNVVMPSVNISGSVVIGDGNLFGVKSTVIQGIKIGNNVTLAPNSVLTRNAKDGKTYLGNPAKIFI